MGDTVSNHVRLVVNKGSSATAFSLPPDVCKVPPTPTPQSFQNSAPLPRLGANQTTNTFIKYQPICVQGTHIGPLSDAAHAGVLGGVKSSTYRFEAEATSWSSDLVIEGKGAVRLLDSTIQNHGNTTGKVIAGIHYARKESDEEYAKKKCNLRTLEGECGHGRTLGWPSAKNKTGEPRYIEILTDDTVTFKVDRRDITKTPNEKSPACVKNHTEWTAKVTKFPNRSTETKTHVGDDWVVEANWGLHWTQHLIPGATGGPAKSQTIDPSNKDMPFQLGDSANDPMQHKAPPPKPPSGGDSLNNFFPADVADRMREADREAYKNRANWHKKHEPVAEIEVDLTDMLKFWAWLLMPPTIDVTAKACSGSKTATIKVYPKDKFTFKFSLTGKAKFRSALATLKAAINNIQKAASVAKRVWSYAGKTLDVQFMIGFELSWECQYIEHTKDEGHRRRIYTQATTGRDWTIKVGAAPLLGVGAEITFSLLNFLVPGCGEAAASVLRKLGVRVDFFCGATIKIPCNLQFGWNEYEKIKFEGINLDVEFEMYGGAMAGAVGVKLIFRVAIQANFQNFFETSKKQGTLFDWQPSAHIQVHVSIQAKAWRWFTWKAYDGVPRPLQVHWKPGKFDLFTPPS